MTDGSAGCPPSPGPGGFSGSGGRSASRAVPAAAAGCQLPSDIVGNFMREDDLIVEPIRFEDGCAVVPDKPGLGVDLDTEALAEYRAK